jgi:hypothetical protein
MTVRDGSQRRGCSTQNLLFCLTIDPHKEKHYLAGKGKREVLNSPLTPWTPAAFVAGEASSSL